MYTPQGLGFNTWNERYQKEQEGWGGFSRRLGFAAASKEVHVEYWTDIFAGLIENGLLMPGGRICYGAGMPKPNMLNCYVLPTGDTREAWGTSLHDMLVVSGLGGGVGINFSGIRPAGSPISGVGGTASGPVSHMRMHNAVGDEIRAGGSRRTAFMHALDVNHPDVDEFIKAKFDRHQLNNANISVIIPPGYGEIPSALWNTIVQHAWESGEPGVLNQRLAEQMNSVGYLHPLVCTNPCGEIWLPNYGCCCLGALVLPNFLKEGRMDWELLAQAIEGSVRFLDNILDVNFYPLPQIQHMAQFERRIGLGVMGLHSMLLDMGIRYNDPRAFRFVDTLFNTMKHIAYTASVKLAKEKGPFPGYTKEFWNRGFAKQFMPFAENHEWTKTGIRNCALLCVAPTGTTSMVHNVSGGVEPWFAPTYYRRRYVGNKAQRTTLVISKDYLDHPELMQGAYDITPYDHMKMQATVQKHVDNSVSKTINIPKEFPIGVLSEHLLQWLPKLKGVTVYRDGSREKEPMEVIPTESMQDHLAAWEGEVEYEGLDTLDCAGGTCTI